jgi:quercetin dioxygenase-like cupin family protein
MKLKLDLLLALSVTLFFAALVATRVLAQTDVVRKPPLDAHLSPEKNVATVEIKEVTIAPRGKTTLHLHPIPVVGVIDEGVIAFQIEGQPLQHLRPGDAFFEPANTRILHFDNEGDTPARFSAFYLLGKNEHELICLLNQ